MAYNVLNTRGEVARVGRVQDEAPGQRLLNFCHGGFSGEVPIGEHRVYRGGMWMDWVAFRQLKVAKKWFVYEVGYRWDDTKPRGKGRGVADARATTSMFSPDPGRTLRQCLIATPADYLERLIDMDKKGAARPNWDHFDFCGMVAVLAAWLGELSWNHKLKLGDLYDVAQVRITPLTGLDDLDAISTNTVFISSMVSGNEGTGAFWPLIMAAAAAGATVATDRVMLTGADCPKILNLGGPALWRAVLEGLGVLAELYDRASGGEVFAFAFIKGLHTVCTVVGHSDEGGFNRDVLRMGTFDVPRGGLPPRCFRYSGIPTVGSKGGASGLVSIVDSLCLQTAALVAQTGAMIPMADGSLRPVIVQGRFTDLMTKGLPPPPEDADKQTIDKYKELQARYNLDVREHVLRMQYQLEAVYAGWGNDYLAAVAKLFGFTKTDECYRYGSTWFRECVSEAISQHHPRHLTKNEVIAPFFWIEPTSILPRKFTGSAAENAGWGSLGCSGDEREERLFDRVEEVDYPKVTTHSYKISFEGARKCLWLQCLQHHPNDGLAQIVFKRVDPQGLILPGPGVTGVGGTDKAFDQKLTLDKYLWRHRPGALSHPAELMNMTSAAVVQVTYTLDDEHLEKDNIPSEFEIVDAMVRLSFRNARGWGTGTTRSVCLRDKRYNTEGSIALASMVIRLGKAHRCAGTDEGFLREAQRWASIGLEPDSTGDRETQHFDPPNSGGNISAKPLDPSQREEVSGRRIAPMYTAGVHTGPRQPQPVTSTHRSGAETEASGAEYTRERSDEGVAAETVTPQAQ